MLMQERHQCTPAEFVLKYTLIYLGLRKSVTEETIDKIYKSNEENQ